MYDRNTQTDLVSGAISAALGAGVVALIAIAQGQHPAIAIGLTIASTIFAVICQKFGAV
jgi:hypothetical protein